MSVEGKKKTGISHPGESHEAEDINETANLGPNVRQYNSVGRSETPVADSSQMDI